MNLFEFEGKALLRKHGIPLPESVLVCSEGDAVAMPFPFVLKAQVMTGGRGKAGGVRVCKDEGEYRKNLREILNMTIKGFSVHGLLAEEMMKPDEEYYLSITQQGVKRPTLIFSRMGGMDIESVAAEHPEELLRIEIDPFTRLKDYQISYLASKMNVEKAQARSFLLKLQEAYFEEHAVLTEINPLGVTGGRLTALDCKFVIDDHAKAASAVRDAIEAQRGLLHKYTAPEKEMTTVTYVPLKGDVAMISDGAGTALLTLDLLTALGADVACFTELGGMTSEEVMYRAMQLTLDGHNEIKGLLIVLIGGFNRMDNMARGIIRYLSEHEVNIPIYTRMCGTMEEEGLRLMAEAGLKTYYDLTDAATQLVQLVKEM